MEFLVYLFFGIFVLVWLFQNSRSIHLQETVDKQMLFIRRLETRICYLEGGLNSAERDDLLKRLEE